MSWMVFEDYLRRPSIGSREWPGSGDNIVVSSDTFCHPRRTLDQFYYPALDDTSIRDADQTVSKWSGRDVDKDGKPKATPDSLLVMAAYQTTYFQDFHEGYATGESSSKVYDGHNELQGVLEVADIIDELKMIRHLLQTQLDILKPMVSALTRLNPSLGRTTEHQNNSMNIQVDADSITGPMTIMASVGGTLNTEQLETTNVVAQSINGQSKENVIMMDKTLLAVLVGLEGISKEAEHTHRLLLDLLDLKSKTAMLVEARSSTKQGQAVMLFTIVTVIFVRSSSNPCNANIPDIETQQLPLSFFTSYFGQNVSEITGDARNPTTWGLWRIASQFTH
ncbi:uncharacterized protein J4E78_004532 [Alternaria triticimaculans]|uniref:uncharacterized protein n=1 Tax=Alternaria triticimaculans TaxID=297637 RepID=UPI0020C31973|nr:uncharacterized protein J4E78_004532 [Alternaria triticimaculans]KAI4661743.1 hypothetical protein J4E78_004532 [Alternaria triticimaculans]